MNKILFNKLQHTLYQKKPSSIVAGHGKNKLTHQIGTQNMAQQPGDYPKKQSHVITWNYILACILLLIVFSLTMLEY